MSDPAEATQADPHPVSGHRTPREIAEDEAGPIGQVDTDDLANGGQSEKSPRSLPEGVHEEVSERPKKDGRSMPGSA